MFVELSIHARDVPSPSLFHCFLHTLRRQRRSTPFPYTTLFRSTLHAERIEREIGALDAAPRGAASSAPISDRKSTRLNSSHLGISYAVFCLKKKKKKTQKHNKVSK